jgi:hypothetical protein
MRLKRIEAASPDDSSFLQHFDATNFSQMLYGGLKDRMPKSRPLLGEKKEQQHKVKPPCLRNEGYSRATPCNDREKHKSLGTMSDSNIELERPCQDPRESHQPQTGDTNEDEFEIFAEKLLLKICPTTPAHMNALSIEVMLKGCMDYA